MDTLKKNENENQRNSHHNDKEEEEEEEEEEEDLALSQLSLAPFAPGTLPLVPNKVKMF